MRWYPDSIVRQRGSEAVSRRIELLKLFAGCQAGRYLSPMRVNRSRRSNPELICQVRGERAEDLPRCAGRRARRTAALAKHSLHRSFQSRRTVWRQRRCRVVSRAFSLGRNRIVHPGVSETFNFDRRRPARLGAARLRDDDARLAIEIAETNHQRACGGK